MNRLLCYTTAIKIRLRESLGQRYERAFASEIQKKGHAGRFQNSKQLLQTRSNVSPVPALSSVRLKTVMAKSRVDQSVACNHSSAKYSGLNSEGCKIVTAPLTMALHCFSRAGIRYDTCKRSRELHVSRGSSAILSQVI
jgi:hypothetical protein